MEFLLIFQFNFVYFSLSNECREEQRKDSISLDNTTVTNMRTFHSSCTSYALIDEEPQCSFISSLTAQEKSMQNEISKNEPAMIDASDESCELKEADMNRFEVAINLTAVDQCDIADNSTAECCSSNGPNVSLNKRANEQISKRRSKRKNVIEDDSDLSNPCKKRRVEVELPPVQVGKVRKYKQRSKMEFKCDLCKYTGRDNWYLKRHIDSVHKNLKPFKCEICLKEFKREEYLKQHAFMHQTHLRFKCQNCSRRFDTYEEKVSHLTICIKRRFECYLCPLKTIYKTTLERHFRLKHIGNNPLCSLCLKQK